MNLTPTTDLALPLAAFGSICVIMVGFGWRVSTLLNRINNKLDNRVRRDHLLEFANKLREENASVVRQSGKHGLVVPSIPHDPVEDA